MSQWPDAAASLLEPVQQTMASIASMGGVYLVTLVLVVFAYFMLRSKQGADSQPGGIPGQSPEEARRRAARELKQDPLFKNLSRGLNPRRETNQADFPDYGHLQGVLYRPEEIDFVMSNPAEPYFWENEYCIGLWLPMFRPTADPSVEKSGDYRYYDHFKGKKRKWEHRLQFKFKVPIEGDGGLRFGIFLKQYAPLGATAKRCLKAVVAALRRVVGQDLYQSPGEPPRTDGVETEPPCFAFPLWAFDQVIETPEGETPPALTDPNFGDYGIKRSTDRTEFIKQVADLELIPGKTVTFGFWCVSPFCDGVNWHVTGILPMAIDFNKFGYEPPFGVGLYTIKNNTLTDEDQRHLQSRKNFIWKAEFWSSKKPPTRATIRELFSLPEDDVDRGADDARPKAKWYDPMRCCVASRSGGGNL